MRPQDDSAYLETALRDSFARRPAPAGLTGRVMAAVRSCGDRTGEPSGGRPFRPPLSLRTHWFLASAAAAALLLALTVPSWLDRREAGMLAREGTARELAEALQLAGHSWNRAEAAALSPIQEDQND